MFKEDQCKTRIEMQNQLLSYFVCSYKSFRSAMLDKQESASLNDEGDVEFMIKMSLAFGPLGAVHILREVGIVTSKPTDCLPHGYIDFLVYGADKTGTVVAMKDTSSPTQLPIKRNIEIGKISATSAKTKTTFSPKASDRQCIMEVLALAEVMKILNSQIKVVVLLKACRDCFQVYVYFTAMDLLIRTAEVPFRDPHTQSADSMMSFFVFYMILNEHINTSLPEMLKYNEGMQSGWQDAYKSCGYKYSPFFCPQKPPKSPIRRQTGQSSPKRMRYNTMYPPIKF